MEIERIRIKKYSEGSSKEEILEINGKVFP
jgi:hypothetical protein